MKIGPVTDLTRYRDYILRFAQLLGHPPYAVEIHLLRKDLQDGAKALKNKICDAASYARENGVCELSLHSLDDDINDLILFSLVEHNSQFLTLMPNRQKVEARDSFQILFDALSEASSCFGQNIVVVAHEGIYLSVEQMRYIKAEGRQDLYRLFHQEIGRIHVDLFGPYTSNMNLYLENSPPYRGENTSWQHYTDQLYFDIADRLSEGDKMVVDISHGFMCREHLANPRTEVYGLDMAAHKQGKTNDYDELEQLGRKIGWFHVNDCNGVFGVNEGLPIELEDSLVDWQRLTGLLKKIDAPMILEVRDSEKDFSKLERSLVALNKYWDQA